MQRIIRGYWDCPYCGTKHIDGLIDNCPHCGKQKSEGTHYYIGNPTDSNDILNEKELESAHMTAEECDGKHREWVCHYCNQLNNWQDDACISCGAPREDEKQENEWKCTSCGRMNAPTADKCGSCGAPRGDCSSTTQNDNAFNSNVIPEAIEEEHISKKAWIATIACIVAVITLIFIPIIHKTIKVTGFKWQTDVNIEENKTFSESDWSKPVGAYDVSESWEYHYSEQVVDHYTTESHEESREVSDGYDTSYRDNGNGTFSEVQTPRYRTEYYTVTEQVPVYRTDDIYDWKYYYKIDRWVIVDTYTKSGNDKSPYYDTDYKLKNKQRDTNKTSKYWIQYSEGKKTYSKVVDEATWKNEVLGTEYNTVECIVGIKYKTVRHEK